MVVSGTAVFSLPCLGKQSRIPLRNTAFYCAHSHAQHQLFLLASEVVYG